MVRGERLGEALRAIYDKGGSLAAACCCTFVWLESIESRHV